MTTSLLHAGYPQSDLTLSAAPDNNPDTTQGATERLTRHAVRRLLDTRRRIQARMWAARAEVIRAQLIGERQRMPGAVR